jgi:uncharacterized LabA/DUF88 family protein
MDRACLFIDAANFYHIALKRLGVQEISFDFEAFAAFLIGSRQAADRGKRFYVGTVREGKNPHESGLAMRNQTALFSALIRDHWIIQTSKLRTRTERLMVDDRFERKDALLRAGITEIVYERSREKGIDVKLATDLVVGAVDDKYDVAIVVSSDTDLVPAIDWTRKRCNKRVEYVGFSFPEITQPGTERILEAVRPTKTLIFNSDVQRVLVGEELRPFIREQLTPSPSAGQENRKDLVA